MTSAAALDNASVSPGTALVIVGDGKMARMLLSFVRHDHPVAGFVVSRMHDDPDNRVFCNRPVVPFDTVETVFPPETHALFMGIGFRDMNAARRRRFDEGRAKGYSFAGYIHPSVMAHDGVTIESPAVVLDHVSVHPGSAVGAGAFISSNVNIGHDCTVGAGSFINSGVCLGGATVLGEDCFLGINATVGDGVTLGARTFVGANTLVTRDTADDTVCYASPGETAPMGSTTYIRTVLGQGG